jgi:hypothetical protein
MLGRVQIIQQDWNIFSCCKEIIDRNNPLSSQIWHTLHVGAVGKYQKFCSRIERYIDRAGGGMLFASSDDVRVT